MDVAALHAVATRAVREAAKLLRGAVAEQVDSKSNPRDLVTEWDLRSERAIRAVLAETQLAILGEEGGASAGSDVRGPNGGTLRWLVDPIDGTVNFAHGLPIWSVCIALEEVDPRSPGSAGFAPSRHGVLAGVVHAPVLGWWFEATRGGGARDGEGKPLRVTTRAPLDRALLSTGFPYDRATNPENNFAEWEHFQRRAGACRRLGCASLDLCLVARGWFDGYWERRLSPWDLAAGALIVEEAGGTVTNTRGGPFDPHSGEAVASNGAIHQELVTELARVRS